MMAVDRRNTEEKKTYVYVLYALYVQLVGSLIKSIGCTEWIILKNFKQNTITQAFTLLGTVYARHI